MYQVVTATHKILKLKKRIRAVAGGTSASKTISILMVLIDYAQTPQSQPKLIKIVSEAYPHLEDGAMRDFKGILQDRNYWKEERWHGTKHMYTFETGHQIQFASIDTYGKAHGPRQDVLYINEANNLDYKIADQLITRTREFVYLDWNPSEEFWFYTEMLPTRDDIDFLTVTYKDNEALDAITVHEIESHRNNKAWWQVYGEGQLGEVEGRIYTGWKIIDEIPHTARIERRGLDFGYSMDPAAIVDVYYYDGGYILDERLYQVQFDNYKLAQFIKALDHPGTLVVADSAEPKSIDEVKQFGVGIIPADKGGASVRRGIQHMQSQRISVTRNSYNLIKEYRRYFWKFDKNGKQLTEPEGGFDHLLDATRYALESLKPQQGPIHAYKPKQMLRLKYGRA